METLTRIPGHTFKQRVQLDRSLEFCCVKVGKDQVHRLTRFERSVLSVDHSEKARFECRIPDSDCRIELWHCRSSLMNYRRGHHE